MKHLHVFFCITLLTYSADFFAASSITDDDIHNHTASKTINQERMTGALLKTVTSNILCCPSSDHKIVMSQLFDDGGPWDQSGNYCKKCCVYLCRKNCTCSSAWYTCCKGAFYTSLGMLALGLGAEIISVGMCGYSDAGLTLTCEGCRGMPATVAQYGGEVMACAVGSALCSRCSIAKCQCSFVTCTKECDHHIISYLKDPKNWGEEERETFMRDLKKYNINL